MLPPGTPHGKEPKETKMRILIAGAGVVGTNLAEQLSMEGHEISLVDSDPEVLRPITDKLDVLTVVGSASSLRTLEEAGIDDAEMVIAVTQSDEVNMIVCMLAASRNVPVKIARVRNEEYSGDNPSFDPAAFGIDKAINPEQIAVDYIIKYINTPGATDVADFAGGRVLMRGFMVTDDMPIANQTLMAVKQLDEMRSVLIVGIYRAGRLTIPNKGDVVIKPGDNIFVVMAKDSLEPFLALLGKRRDETKKLVIYGATLTGVGLAGQMEEQVDNIVLIESDPERAKRASQKLASTLVLQGEGSDLDTLREAGVSTADFFVSVSGDNEDNLMAALLAKKEGAKRGIVLTTEPRYIGVFKSIGLEIVINPRLITAGMILQHVRRGRVLSAIPIRDRAAEVLEFEAEEHTRGTGKPLHRVWKKFTGGSIVGAISRNGELIIPDGNSIIEPGDNVIVFALPEAIRDVENLFVKR